MNYDLLFALVFYILLVLFFYKNRKHVKLHAKIIALYRTKLGLEWMDRAAKSFPRLLRVVSYVSIFTGFAGMLFIIVILLRGTYNMVFNGGMPVLAPVLPGVKILGLPTLGFWHWIIAIFVVAIVHEFSHGIFARLEGLKVKSSGLALFGPILAAFVEPDEKAMAKKPKKAQLGILSAGPFSNLVLGGLFLLIAIFLAPLLQNAFFESDGIMVSRLIENTPAFESGLKAPFVIYSISGIKTSDFENFLKATDTFKPNKMVELITNKGRYELKAIKHPDNSSKGYAGIADFSLSLKIKSGFAFLGRLPYFSLWLNKLIFWLFVVNIGVGLFNLLPLGIVDGGRMFYLFTLIFIKDEKKAKKIWTYVSIFLLLIILVNIFPYLWRLVLFLNNLLV